MTIVLGLTGSIGMGKTTTAQMFRDLAVPVWDADAVVRRLYGKNGLATSSIRDLVPDAVTPDGVDRAVLKKEISRDPTLLGKIEASVHPLVAQDRAEFLDAFLDAALVVLDIPLLFETGGDAACDATLVVTTDPAEQRRRVLARGTSPEMFQDLLSRQLPDAEKRHRATYVIRTDALDETRRSVADLVSTLKGSTA